MKILSLAVLGLLVAGTWGCSTQTSESEDDPASGQDAISTPRDEAEKQAVVDQRKRMNELQPLLEKATGKDFGKDFPANLDHFFSDLVHMVSHSHVDPDAAVFSFKNGAYKTYVFQAKSRNKTGGTDSYFELYDAVKDKAGKELKPSPLGECKTNGKSDVLTCKTVAEGAYLFEGTL